MQINTEIIQNKQKIQYDNLLAVMCITYFVMLMAAKKLPVLKYSI
jgi:hypothetical protein